MGKKSKKQNKSTLALNMIVKNESKTLPFLFKSLHKIIDYYVILDTGSTDGTPELIKTLMDEYNIKGEVHHMEWVNFGVCRQKALELVVGKADYMLIIDADEEFNYTKPSFFKKMTKDQYFLLREYGSSEYYLPGILNIRENNKLGWCWKGVVHNYVSTPSKNVTTENIDKSNVYIKSNVHGGAKTHGVTSKEKYMRDVNLLLKELEKNPDDTRSQFYLAQSYKDAQMNDEAIEHYKKRIKMRGWVEEMFYSQYMIGKILYNNGGTFDELYEIFMEAYKIDNRRIEPIYYLIELCRKEKKYHLGYLLGKGIWNIRSTKAILFIDIWVYNYSLLDVFSVCAYWAGDYELSYKCCQILLDEKKIPNNFTERIKNNMKFAKMKLM